MSRKLRYAPIGIAQHVIQRGNNRQVCFCNDEDMLAYLEWLKQYADKYQVHIHAWVLMTNHVHLLCTPHSQSGVSKMMQSLGRSYVYYFNKRYKRSGTLWEGRFKSALVDSENYLFQLYKYIELNPVAAGMVNVAADYKWSSYKTNALGKASKLIKPHPNYLLLGKDLNSRLEGYRSLFGKPLSQSASHTIKTATESSLAIGSNRFLEQIEALTGQSFRIRNRGRPSSECG
ncbi:transposase [Vibrio hangzhouensis]|uniref:Putative transposase n=1 Tax=Vibrio hangzhouensis TaxID=462991 RepID=A0A1H6BZB2_9VIBR|nr:transposase [Vibrio hangzhouensis]SEG66049.1 putative transposase [Vibrio hangzhouensis]